MNKEIEEIGNKILTGSDLTKDEALFLVNSEDLYDILYFANKIRAKFKKNTLRFCSIINAKSGACSEDCKFCAQSIYYDTQVNTYSLVDFNTILKSAKQAKETGADGFSIVTSGKGVVSDDELKVICNSIGEINKLGLYSCVSLGEVNESEANILKNNGLIKYHHNLETSRRFFPQICTTHTYDDKIKTIITLKKTGLKVCCGGIFGLGETREDWVELAFTLKDLNVDSIPINFLNPKSGTPFEGKKEITPLLALRIIALYRFVLPNKDIKVCGGREVVLRDLQSWMYYAGANGTMLGNYLTTSGRPCKEDIQMLKDLELR
ncbi:MAG: biotin synthase BioB [Candidatus Firestonebacteria bacterium]